jgi:hypothetical protein
MQEQKMVSLIRAEKTLAIHSLFDEVLVYRAKFGDVLSEEESELVHDILTRVSLLCSLDADGAAGAITKDDVEFGDELYATALRCFRERKQDTN